MSYAVAAASQNEVLKSRDGAPAVMPRNLMVNLIAVRSLVMPVISFNTSHL